MVHQGAWSASHQTQMIDSFEADFHLRDISIRFPFQLIWMIDWRIRSKSLFAAIAMRFNASALETVVSCSHQIPLNFVPECSNSLSLAAHWHDAHDVERIETKTCSQLSSQWELFKGYYLLNFMFFNMTLFRWHRRWHHGFSLKLLNRSEFWKFLMIKVSIEMWFWRFFSSLVLSTGKDEEKDGLESWQEWRCWWQMEFIEKWLLVWAEHWMTIEPAAGSIIEQWTIQLRD